jgi:putative aldouronate transport system substrate-binding protein
VIPFKKREVTIKISEKIFKKTMGNKFKGGNFIMYKKWKTVMPLLLTCVLAVGLFSGCAGKKEQPATTATTAETANTASTASTATAQQTADSGALKNEKKEKLVIFYPFAGTQTPEGIDEVKAALEEKMKDSVNVSLDWIIIPREGFEEKMNTMLASGEQFDAGVGDMDDLGTAAGKPGLVRSLGDLIDQFGKNLKNVISEDTWNSVKNSKGEITCIPAYNRYYWQGAVIRKDWLDKVGLAVPKTLDELEAVMDAFKNMNSKVIPSSGAAWYLEPLIMSAVNGGISPNFEWDSLNDAGDKAILTFTNPKYKKFLELYNKWLDKGWLNKDFLATDDQQNDQLFSSGKIGILFTDPHSSDRYEKVLQLQDPNAKVTFIPVLDGPGGKAAFGLNNGIDRVVWINKNGPHPERVVQYFDWQVSNIDNFNLARYGIEGKHWVKSGDKWTLPADTNGDPNKRAYSDIFAPLVYEALGMKRTDEPAINAEIDAAYKSVPVIQPRLKGFTVDFDKIGSVNTIDIWGEMYNIAVKARPLSDYEKLCDEFYKSGGSKIYDEMTRQYLEWKAKQ